MIREVKLTLPWPVSLSRYYRCVPRMGPMISSDGRNYHKSVDIGVQLFRQEMKVTREYILDGKLYAVYVFYAPTKRKYDIDNYMKALQDAMEKAKVFKNDNQIDFSFQMKAEVTKPGKVDVHVLEYTSQKEMLDYVSRVFSEVSAA